MNTKTILPIIALTFLVLTLNLASAIIVDTEYSTVFPGEQKEIRLEVENSFDFDIEDVSIALELSDVPFNVVGSSEKGLDDLDSDDDDSATFKLIASTDALPGDYNIPYVVKYTNVENSSSEQEEKTGSFGIRISAKTEIDFSVETENEVVGQQGKISLKIINKGLGEVKFVSVQVFPSGYELLSPEKVYIGNIDSDDSDFASFDVVFKSSAPTLSAKVEYKDFDNNEKSQTVTLPVKVYTREKALELGLIKESKTGLYGGIVAGILIIWFIWRKIRKRRKNKNRGKN